MKQQIIDFIQTNAASFKDTAFYIGSHPELGHCEFKAAERLTAELVNFGFSVEQPVLEIPTAFIATYKTEKQGPTIAFLAEYDALPDIGHACGHHLIGTMSVAAAAGLRSVIDQLGGTIRVYGTPAEETKGAKVPMAAEGLFDDVDAAMMAHPYHAFERSGTSLAMDALQFEFFGKAAHAAASPYEGINALDAVILLFNAVNALRQQLPDHVRIHGIINEGGKAANIIPDYASAQFYVRSASRAYTDQLAEKVLNCARGAAMQTGCRLETSNYEYSYDELNTNETLSAAFTRNLLALGIAESELTEGKDNGSLDLGNVSLRCPAIHPFVKVVDQPFQLHSIEFRDAAMKQPAIAGMLLGAQALACTALDLLSDPALLKAVREEFSAKISS